MVIRRPKTEEPEPNHRRPATTPEGREAQLVALAVDAAEQQLRAGTASAQVITHFLKLGSSREMLEQERLRLENEFTQIKADQIASQKKTEELYAKALNAMRRYQGESVPEDELDYED